MNPILLLDYAGVAVFAATGALAASRKQLDIIGFLFLAAVTGTGGGTLRDVLLGHMPVFWVANPAYMLVCAAIGVLVSSPRIWSSRATGCFCGWMPSASPPIRRWARPRASPRPDRRSSP
jgi:uncharacterized membrane protein YeiH